MGSARGSGSAQPVVVDGVLYTPCTDRHGWGLCARAADSGRLLWRRKSSGSEPTVAPVVANGRVYVGWNGASTASVLAYSSRTGATVWRWSDPAPPQSWLAHDDVWYLLGYRGRVFATTNDGYLTGLDGATGRMLWHRTADHYQSGSVLRLEAAAHGFVYAVAWSQGGGFYTLNPANGRVVWTGGQGAGDITVGGGRVIQASSSSISAWRSAGCGSSTCTALWQLDLPADNDNMAGAVDSHIAAITQNNYRTGKLYVLNAATGHLNWQTTVDQGIGPVTRNRDLLFVAAFGPDRLYAYPVHCKPGCAPLWHTKLGSGTNGYLSGITIASHRIFVHTAMHDIRTYHR